MAKSTRARESVVEFLAQLEHPLKADIEAVRAVILTANDGITEHVKWNAPSFCFEGDDRVTMRLQPGNRLDLIFHRGAKVKDATDFAFVDGTGLMKWVTADRAVVSLKSAHDITAHRDALADLVDRWVRSTSETAS
ncbi:MAG: hypothetical protein AVDCRST_MAG77-4803 [uncultured Chloroflexi bacterium]|uniref:YdhG-like domain-containing protein n=1 Tax=uncultured Chloroflexota bacterium TaxID=166587 RepID=A0A6J4JT14_9CHLR|nr:MAG: hypothetical protein AVDCRST_MAG77-4803 [uncultured Chloroflexota bacterium]